MGKIKDVGNKLRKTQDESGHNVRRVGENFPTPEITVKDFNKLYNYKKTFQAHSDSTVRATLKLKEITTPCSINPPITSIWCRVQFEDYGNSTGGPGTLLENNGDFIFEAPNIIVPEDGCYGVTWSSSAWGVGIEVEDAAQIATFYHNGKVVRSFSKPTTGIIHVLGPFYWQYPSIPHLYQVIECKAGDTISATVDGTGIDACWEWWGCRRGFFTYIDTTTLRIDLIASAENV